MVIVLKTDDQLIRILNQKTNHSITWLNPMT